MMYHVKLFTNSSVKFHPRVEKNFDAIVDTRISKYSLTRGWWSVSCEYF